MAAREFSSRASAPDPDPITFTLDVAPGREFRCVRMVPPAAVTALQALPALVSDDDPRHKAILATHIAAHMAFIRTTVVPEDRDDWDALTVTQPIAPDCYAEMVGWLCDTYAERLNTARVADELDPIAARQAELNREAHGEAGFDVPGALPPDLQTILDAGGGFSR